MHKEVIEKLCGLPVYFDLAFISEFTDADTLLSIIRTHGADKILFASDSPWSDPGVSAERIKALSLTEKELRMIFSENALSILHV